MNLPECFKLHINRVYIVRTEGEYYSTFDPIDLAFFKINRIGAEILYMISNGGKVSEIIAYLSDNYDISLENARDDTFSFRNYCQNEIHMELGV